MSWAVFLGAFVGSLIELVEVLAVVFVVGRVAGWRNALVGAGSAVGLVAVAPLVAGRGLALIPARPLELIAGAILLGFGQAWARSVTKYYGGTLKASADDDVRLRERLTRNGGRGGWDAVAMVTAFKSSLLESFEIAIVVIGLGTAGGAWVEAIGGALVASAILIFVALWLRTSLERVPVKPAKFIAATLLMGFGTYWVGEGLGFEWPGGVLFLLWLPLLWGLLMAGGGPCFCVRGVARPRWGRDHRLPGDTSPPVAGYDASGRRDGTLARIPRENASCGSLCPPRKTTSMAGGIENFGR